MEKTGINTTVFKAALICIVALTILLFHTSPASSRIYRYKDKKGVWHFSNIKTNKHYKPYLTQNKEKKQRRKYNGNENQYDKYILLASQLFQVDRSFIKAIIKAESSFDHRAVSSKGAKGLMQLMPTTAAAMDVIDPFDPKENIIGGTRYISSLLKRFKNDKSLALAAYNAGPTKVESRKGIPPFSETKTFVKRVLKYYKNYK